MTDSPLPEHIDRSVASVEPATDDEGGPATRIMCDCGHVTRVSLGDPVPREAFDYPIVCDGCLSVHWLRITPPTGLGPRHLAVVELALAEMAEHLCLKCYAPADWDADADTLHAPFGYMPPYMPQGKFGYVFPLCPELIAAQVDHLEDPLEVEDYLLVMRQHLGLHVTHHEMAPEPLERFIDQLVYDTAPISASAATRIQARALDQRRASSDD